jgi:hypothetical protein
LCDVWREQSDEYSEKKKAVRALYDKGRPKPDKPPPAREPGTRKVSSLGTLGKRDCGYCDRNPMLKSTQRFLVRQVSSSCRVPRALATCAG